MKGKPSLFLDTSALIAGIWSAEGGARMLLRLGEAEVVQLQVSPQVLQEIEVVVRKKATHYLPILALLIDRSRASVVKIAPHSLADRCQELVPHPGDARIFADAWHNHSNYLVTLDKLHFLEAPGLASAVPFPIGTPGDCLGWVRAQMKERGN